MLIVKLDRLGRNHNPEPFRLTDKATIDTAPQIIANWVRPKIRSKDFEVRIVAIERANPTPGRHPLDGATVDIEFGRFGSGIITQQEDQ